MSEIDPKQAVRERVWDLMEDATKAEMAKANAHPQAGELVKP